MNYTVETTTLKKIYIGKKSSWLFISKKFQGEEIHIYLDSKLVTIARRTPVMNNEGVRFGCKSISYSDLREARKELLGLDRERVKRVYDKKRKKITNMYIKDETEKYFITKGNKAILKTDYEKRLSAPPKILSSRYGYKIYKGYEICSSTAKAKEEIAQKIEFLLLHKKLSNAKTALEFSQILDPFLHYIKFNNGASVALSLKDS
jgi:hypothetical protein